jgi:hypothetical protein
MLAAAALIVIGTAPIAAAPKNLLKNPDFEQGLKGHPWMPAGWDTSASGLASTFFGRDTFAVRSGRHAVNVASASAVLPIAHNWSQTLLVGKEAWGKDAVFSVWTKSIGMEGRAYVKLEVYRDTLSKMAKVWGTTRNAAAERLGIQHIDDPKLDLGWRREFFSEPETDWVRRELRVHVPPSVNVLFIRGGLLGVGQLFLDDASLTIEPARPAPEPPLKTNLLADPGFEGDGNAWELSLPPYPGMKAERDTTVKNMGNASLRFSSSTIGFVSGKAGACQVFPDRGLAGKRIRFSGFMKSDTLKSSAYLTLYCHTLDGPKQATAMDFQAAGTTDWKLATVEMDVPPDTYEVWAWFAYTAPAEGVVWFDDGMLEVLGPATGRP